MKAPLNSTPGEPVFGGMASSVALRSVVRAEAADKRFLARWMLKYRVWILGLGHALVFAVAYWLAFALRFDFEMPARITVKLQQSIGIVIVIKLVIFFAFQQFHGWWRYVTFADLVALGRATLFALIAIVLLNHYVLPRDGEVYFIPRGVVILDTITTGAILGLLRSSWRLYREGLWVTMGKKDRRPMLMVGADHQTSIVAHQIQMHPDAPYRIVGFVDLANDRCGARLGGIPIIGCLHDVASLAHDYKAAGVLVVGGNLPGADLRNLMDECERSHLSLKVIPSVLDHLNNDHQIPIRDVAINDLLRREPVELDMEAISAQIAGKSVMVTGAGGSIGAEICRQLLQFHPERLILLDQAENSLFLINAELAYHDAEVNVDIVPCVANVLDHDRMRRIFVSYSPDFVFHAAAHKHVGLMEGNVVECVQNNVFGTKSVADLANEFDATKFVLISTDKAVHPSSIMGASKQIAERYIHALAQESSSAFLVVRFGNVLGSNGSVVPIFQEQIRRGGPITVTDERMTRFFMTIPEASQLVLQASAMGRGGEIFVLEMGDQIRIVDLARDLVRLSGLPQGSIEIVYVGARPGEKLFEELYFDDEQSLKTRHAKVRAAYHRPYSVSEVLESIQSLKATLEQGDAAVRQKLKEVIPEFGSPRDDEPPSERSDVHRHRESTRVGFSDQDRSGNRNGRSTQVNGKKDVPGRLPNATDSVKTANQQARPSAN